jgi:hypothetical protein
VTVIVTHQGHRLAIHGSASRAYRVLARYPEGSQVVTVPGGVVLSTVISRFRHPARLDFTGQTGVAGARVPSFETVRCMGDS